MKLHVITIATGIYNIYLNDLINSIFNVLQKELLKFNIDIDINIISDKNYISENSKYNNIIKNYHIINMPYPLVNLSKLLYIYDVYKVNNYDLNDKFIYVDADSYFISDCDYSTIVNDILDNDMVFAISPWIWDKELSSSDNYVISLCENPKYNSASYRKNPVNKNFSQTSFFSTSGLMLNKLNNIIYNYVSLDLNINVNNRYIPKMSEQSYINKFLDEQLNNNNILINNCKIKVDKYIFDDYSDLYINNPKKCKDYINKFSNKIFVIQKMKYHLKDKKRNSYKYNIVY